MEFRMQGTSIELGESFLSDTIGLSHRLLCNILSTIENLPSLELLGDARNYHLANLTSDISRFVEITTLSSKVIMAKNPVLMAQVKDSHIHLLFILKAMNQAQQKQDSMALEDLIKYELKDNLTLWKIDLIPQSKRLLS